MKNIVYYINGSYELYNNLCERLEIKEKWPIGKIERWSAVQYAGASLIPSCLVDYYPTFQSIIDLYTNTRHIYEVDKFIDLTNQYKKWEDGSWVLEGLLP